MHTFHASDGTYIHHHGTPCGQIKFNQKEGAGEGATDVDFQAAFDPLIGRALGGENIESALAALSLPSGLSRLALREYAGFAVEQALQQRIENLSVDELVRGAVRLPSVSASEGNS